MRFFHSWKKHVAPVGRYSKDGFQHTSRPVLPTGFGVVNCTNLARRLLHQETEHEGPIALTIKRVQFFGRVEGARLAFFNFF